MTFPDRIAAVGRTPMFELARTHQLVNEISGAVMRQQFKNHANPEIRMTWGL